MTRKKTVVEVPTAPTGPAFGGIVSATGADWEGVPDGPNPFYVAAGDGMYLHRRMLIGRGLARVDHMPPYPKFGNKDGGFWFEADPVPAVIMGQIVNFFERIYDRQHTEAAVLLIMHKTTKEWRVFVPTQLVSHGGVNYVFDPMHIRSPWIIVGSIHSHCDFGAGHSSTDTGDAAEFDGLHCTIGHIKRDEPEIVAMVAMNKKLFHYPKEQFPMLFDFSRRKEFTAPEWWDRYVENTITKTKPVGFELYAKFQKPTVIKTEAEKKSETKITFKPKAVPGLQRHQPSPGYQSSGFVSEDYSWNEVAGRMVHKNWTIHEDGSITYPSGVKVPKMPDIKRPEMIPGVGVAILNESRVFNARQLAERGLPWDKETGGLKVRSVTSEDLMLWEAMRRDEERDKDIPAQAESDYWEENVTKEFLDLLFDSELISEEDLIWAANHPDEATTGLGWARVFTKKLYRVTVVLRNLGFENMKIDFGTPPGSQQILLGEPEAPKEHMAGVH